MDVKILVHLLLMIMCLSSVGFAQTVNDMDVVLLMDSSDDLRSSNFNEEKKFALNLVSQIFNPNVRLAVYTFARSTYPLFTLDRFSDVSQIKHDIQRMWYLIGHGNVESAINITAVDAFQTSKGDRECVANFLIILTHSLIKDTATATMLKGILDERNVRAIVLNMAGASATDEFAAMTNDPNLVANIRDWASLQTAVPTVSRILLTDRPRTGCGLMSNWGDWTGCSSTCGEGLQFKTRQCIKDSPSDLNCTGNLSEQKTCFTTECTDTEIGMFTHWEAWTACSMTCGEGFQFRTRSCIKQNPTDSDCIGIVSDQKDCMTAECTDPIDGGWAFWGKWGPCSKTCNNGAQQRTRQCSQPTPVNGGKPCPGNGTHTRTCAEYSCPDCGRQCPGGGHLSADCQVCECSQLTLFGQIMDDGNTTVESASIFLESSKYRPLATTDRFGKFKVDGVCLMNEELYIDAQGCLDKHIKPIVINSTHWTLPEFRLDRNVPPVFTVQPEDKVRMVGQSLSLCCAAVGKPLPSSYKWFKDGIELEYVGTNGTLFLVSVKETDTGSYTCYTETDASVSLSDVAEVTVKRAAADTCGPPLPSLQELPFGCYVTGDTSRNTTINVGNCGKLPCMTSSLHDNGSCSDYWPHHCCNDKDVELVEIMCDGFSYKTSIVRSCECKLCMYKTILSGRAFGRANKTNVPLQLGEIIIDGKVVARTSMAGIFKLELPKGTKRIEATFKDNVFMKLTDVTKVIHVNSGSETFATIVIPLKPTPIPFDSSAGHDLHLGGSVDGQPHAAKLSIPAHSIVTQDGQLYSGKAQILVHFMDPRNRDDIEAANGDFEAESPDGKKIPLKTFGMFSVGVEDGNGTELKINKPLQLAIDSSLFNFPIDTDGNLDVALWSYDINKGIWVETAKFRNETKPSGRRKLLQTSSSYVTEVNTTSIKVIDQYDTNTKVVTIIKYPYHNVDSQVRTYQYVTTKTPKAGACFVAVSVYKDLTLTEPYTTGDIEIKTFVRDITSRAFEGYTLTKVLNSGRACIPIFCDKLVDIHVARYGNEYFYAGQHYLPHPGYVRNTTEYEVEFESRDFGVQAQSAMLSQQPHIKPNTVFYGPIFQFVDKFRCSSLLATDNSFQFKFAPFTKAPTISYTVGSGVFDKKLSWYPVSPAKLTFRSCFIKVEIKVQGSFDMRLLATSYLEHYSKQNQFGTYQVGPRPDPAMSDLNFRGACVEFRCPGLVHDGGNQRTDMHTIVDVHLKRQGIGVVQCRLENVKGGVNAKPNYNNVTGNMDGFRLDIEPGNNYGEKYGIFMSNNPASETLKMCESGVTFQNDVSFSPMKNAGVTMNCL